MVKMEFKFSLGDLAGVLKDDISNGAYTDALLLSPNVHLEPKPAQGTVAIMMHQKQLGEIQIKPDAIALLLEDKLGAASVKIVASAFEAGIDKIGLQHKGKVMPELPPIPDPKNPELKSLKDLVAQQMANDQAKYKSPDQVAAENAKKADELCKQGMAKNAEKVMQQMEDAGLVVKKKVKLSDATQLLQPVSSTDPDSVYHTVAIGADANMAIRIRKEANGVHRLSARLEGDNAGAYNTTLVNAGWDKKKDTHYSIHIECDTADLTRKAVGSMVYSTGIEFDEVQCNVIVLEGKGA